MDFVCRGGYRSGDKKVRQVAELGTTVLDEAGLFALIRGTDSPSKSKSPIEKVFKYSVVQVVKSVHYVHNAIVTINHNHSRSYSRCFWKIHFRKMKSVESISARLTT